MNSESNRHDDAPRSMYFAAVCFVGCFFLAGLVAGFVLRPFVLGALAQTDAVPYGQGKGLV